MQAVYHGYSLVYGTGMRLPGEIMKLGRWWLLGNQNGWHNVEGAFAEPPKDSSAEMWRRDGEYYRRLLDCHRRLHPGMSHAEVWELAWGVEYDVEGGAGRQGAAVEVSVGTALGDSAGDRV